MRTQCTTFANNVYGVSALDAANLEKPEGMALPSAFIVLDQEDNRKLSKEIGLIPPIEERFAVVLCVSNITDDDGFTSADRIDALTSEVLTCLLNWPPDANHMPIQYLGSRYVLSTSMFYFWMMEFTTTRIGSSIFEYEIGVQLILNGGAVPGTVLGLIATAVASLTGGTRLGSDYSKGLQLLSASTLYFRLRGVAAVTVPESNAWKVILPIVLNVLYHMPVGYSERTYTEGNMQTHVATLLTTTFWKVAGVGGFKSIPNFKFPTDASRVF